MNKKIELKELTKIENMGGVLYNISFPLQVEDEIKLVAGVFAPGEKMKIHKHNPPTKEVYFIYRGRGKVIVDNKDIPVSAGSAVVIMPGEVHYLENTGKEDLEALFIVTSPSEGSTVIL